MKNIRSIFTSLVFLYYSSLLTSFPGGEPGQIKFAKTCGSQSNVGSQCVPNTAGIMNHVTHNLQASLISDDDAELHKFPMSESEGRCNAQKTLHLCLKPELSELCDTLKLPVCILMIFISTYL